MDMLEFEVILLTAHRVVIDCDHRRVTTYTPADVCFMFLEEKHDALPPAMYYSRWHGQLMGWLESLTLEDEEDRSWIYLRWFASMRMFFQINYWDYLRGGMLT